MSQSTDANFLYTMLGRSDPKSLGNNISPNVSMNEKKIMLKYFMHKLIFNMFAQDQWTSVFQAERPYKPQGVGGDGGGYFQEIPSTSFWYQ